MNTSQHAAELIALARELDVPLPYDVDFIIAQELAGHIVDLLTGEIILNGADVRYTVTPAGQAAADAPDDWSYE